MVNDLHNHFRASLNNPASVSMHMVRLRARYRCRTEDRGGVEGKKTRRGGWTLHEELSDVRILNSNSKFTSPLSVRALTHDRMCCRGRFFVVGREGAGCWSMLLMLCFLVRQLHHHANVSSRAPRKVSTGRYLQTKESGRFWRRKRSLTAQGAGFPGADPGDLRRLRHHQDSHATAGARRRVD